MSAEATLPMGSVALKRSRIAVIGSGIAGLSCAWLLGRTHSVTLFESSPAPGMGVWNLDVPYGRNAAPVRIDLPVRAFNQGHYRNLRALYRALGVRTRRTDHAAAIHFPNDPLPRLAWRNLNIGQRAIPHLLVRQRPGFLQAATLLAMGRLLTEGAQHLRSGRLSGQSLHDYLTAQSYPRLFIDQVLLPITASIGTCSMAAARRYPADVVVEFLSNGLLFGGIWRARDGADDAIARMLAPVEDIRCGRAVLAVRTGSDQVCLEAEGSAREYFDHAVLAGQASRMAHLLGPEQAELKALLATIPFERSRLLVHTDPNHVAGFHRGSPAVHFEVDQHRDATMATILLNRLYPELCPDTPVFQTWNPLRQPSADHVLRSVEVDRPLVTVESQLALRQMQALLAAQPLHGGLSVAGSWAWHGMPLLESGVQSAQAVANRFGIALPTG